VFCARKTLSPAGFPCRVELSGIMSDKKDQRPAGISRRGFLKTGAGVAALDVVGQGAPQEPVRPAPTFSASTPLQRLSQHLFLLEDTCNVYLLTHGTAALVVDFGSGRVLDVMSQVGASKVDWILHTHHHRDQAQGDYRAVAGRIPIAVPAHERHLFEDAENFWRNRRVNHLYAVRNDFFTVTGNIPVTRLLNDYETFRWGPYEFLVLPTPGHTMGSVTLVARIDGRTVAFSGDLIFAPGKVQTLHDLQYNYAGMEGVDFSVYSLTGLMEQKPELVCPSHGQPMPDPLPGIQELIDKLSGWHDYWRGPTMITRNRPIAVSPHLVAHHLAVSSFYAIISDSGKALFLDYGQASNTAFLTLKELPDIHDRMRFLEHSISTLRAEFGLKSIDVAIPSHIHDDHISGFPHLARHYGTRVWCYENMREILERPNVRNLGCLLPDPIRVDRTFRHKERFKWEEFEFTVVHSPGHTDFQMAMFADIDGARVAFTGDAFFNTPALPGDGYRHNLIYRNDVYGDSHSESLRNILEFEPNIIAPGHGSPFMLNRTDVDRFRKRLEEQKRHFQSLIADSDIDFGLDPSWVHIYPYQARISPGQKQAMEVRVRNHRSSPLRMEIALVLPSGWRSAPAVARMEVPANSTGRLEFEVSIPAAWSGTQARVAIAADVMAGGKYLGQIAEAVVDLPGGRQPAR
jgi:glyoxylase-like metal-dependent hydrolase (beta-lactamase superfamily II)